MNNNMNNMNNIKKGGGIEYEYQIIDINKKDIVKKLKSLGAKKIHKKILYSSMYFWKNDSSEFFRVRKEFNNITITKKILKRNNKLLEHVEEYEISIYKGSDFKDIINFIKQIIPSDFNIIRGAEKYREKWSLKDLCHEIVFDTWPGLDEYIELDCNTEKELKKILKLLNLEKNKRYTGGVFDYYIDFYGIKDRNMLKNLSYEFSNVFYKELLKHATKNKHKLLKLK